MKKEIDINAYINSRIKMIPTCIISSISKKVYNNGMLMVNIGSGVWHSRYWKSLDFYSSWYGGGFWWKHTVDYDYDLTSKKPMPFDDNSVDLFYSEFAFEHIPQDSCEYVFSEMYRVLKKGGGIRIIVPDMDIIYDDFLLNKYDIFEFKKKVYGSYFKAFLEYFTDVTIDSEEVRKWFDECNMEDFLNKCTKLKKKDNDSAGIHTNWFTFKKISKMFVDAGFNRSNIIKTIHNETIFKDIKGKGFNTRPGYPALYIEVIK